MVLSFWPSFALWILVWPLSDRSRFSNMIYFASDSGAAGVMNVFRWTGSLREEFSVDKSRHRKMVKWNVMQSPLLKIRCLSGQEDPIRGNEHKSMPFTHIQRSCTVLLGLSQTSCCLGNGRPVFSGMKWDGPLLPCKISMWQSANYAMTFSGVDMFKCIFKKS